MRKVTRSRKAMRCSDGTAAGQCLCGSVVLEIDIPAFWVWHDHSEASQRAQGCAYATYVGCWRSRFRIVQGADDIHRFEDRTAGGARNFCGKCGTPLFYERDRSPQMVNIPRALFAGRTGREPRYHLAIEQAPEWAYRGERLVPLKGYSGVVWSRPRRTVRRASDNPFSGQEL